MLESLSIRNYAIIDEMTVEFTNGLNVLTGETGAGKSIVVDAFELVLGARASGDLIRAGASSMTVTGVFSLQPGTARGFIPEELGDENVLILRREIRADGGNRCFVNDQPATLKTLTAIGERLVDLHGQHDHQSLLNSSEHAEFLDRYGGFAVLSRETARLYRERGELARSVRELEAALHEYDRDRELKEFQAHEIEDADPQPGEDDRLADDIGRLSRATELKAAGLGAFQELSEADGSVSERLGVVLSELESCSRYDSRLDTPVERLQELAATVQDVAAELREYAEGIDEDPESLQALEDRLALIERLKKKYGPTIGDVLAHYEAITGESRRRSDLEAELDRLRERAAEVDRDLAMRAHELSERRHAAAPGLGEAAGRHLADLGMTEARLVADVSQFAGTETIDANGANVPIWRGGFDTIEFLFSANPGEPLRPLAKVASGGEISRVMLALKLVLINVAEIPTMIFDEIDSGVSGRIGEAMGRKLQQLAAVRQVIVITHLPQIAAMADRHFSARKGVRDGRTHAHLVVLDEPGREEELAGLLSGEALADTARAHARELLQRMGGGGN